MQYARYCIVFLSSDIFYYGAIPQGQNLERLVQHPTRASDANDILDGIRTRIRMLV